jgi:Acyl-coenzyme A:6-aminopenicillanic acid acyl-transferase
MSILKNEQIFPSQSMTHYLPEKQGDYCKPRHIIVAGSWEEIGHDLGSLAKSDYGVQLERYESPIYGKARRAYMMKNWPQMAAMQKGVLTAFGLPGDSDDFDGTTLSFDWYDQSRTGFDMASMKTCSCAVLPAEMTDTGATYVSRNYDMSAVVLWSAYLGKPIAKGAWGHGERWNVIEFRPEEGYRCILSGAGELLSPWGDGINEHGLYCTVLRDPDTVGLEGVPCGGGNLAGVTNAHILLMLLSTCKTVEEAKIRLVESHVTQTLLNFHIPIADAQGNATVFEIDKRSSAFVFTDRKKGEPLFITNHAVHLYPTPDTYPEAPPAAAHNTFNRQQVLRATYAGLTQPLKRDHATVLTDSVHCAYVDDELAENGPVERTMAQVNADLSKREMKIRWYLGDVGPIKGTNDMEDRQSEWVSFGF